MRQSQLLLLTGLLILLAIPLASATTTLHIQPTDTSSHYIFFDETASYQLTIINNGTEDKIYSWSINPVEWVIEGKNSMRVEAQTSRTAELLVTPRPSNFRGPGLYIIPVVVEDAFGNTYQESIPLTIRSINDPAYSYLASVALGASLNDPLSPAEQANVQIQVRNRNILDITELELYIDGEIFSHEDTFPLAGLEEKTLRYRLDVDPVTTPGMYPLHVFIRYENKTLSEVKTFYDVEAYSSIRRESATAKQFLKSTTVIQLTNVGNIVKSVDTDLDLPAFNRLYAGIDIEATNLEKNKGRSWTIILDPYETATVTIVKNYRYLVFLLLLTLAGIIAYFSLRSPITMQKQIIVTGKDDEGISEMKVRIFLKNRTDKAYYNLRLLDKAPAIADVHAPHSLGVIGPTKIVKTEKKGTIIKWDFEALDAYEERIVSYTIKAKLKIIGNLSLPAVRIKFENVKGVTRTTQSGKAVIGTKQ